MKPNQPLKSYLEFCRRLGFRYLSTSPSKGTTVQNPTVIPTQEVYAGPFESREIQAQEEPLNTSPSSGTKSFTRLSVKPKWLTASLDSVQAMELTAFEQDIHECQNCPLGKTRKNFVFGSGNPQAEVMFVGEAPGADEDAQGLPFVGKAGQLLTKIIESTKTWKREDVFICNVLKCRPPGNRTPLPEEVEQCRPYLEEQIRIIQPKLIMALGASAAQALLKTKDSVGKLRNRWHDFQGVPLRVTYHPAALLRFDGYKKDVWEDMKELTLKFAEIKEK